jgi:hypothetical protein
LARGGATMVQGMIEQAAKVFLDLQNRFRGLVSEFRSKKFVKDRQITQSQMFRSGLRGLMLNARAALEPTQYSPFVQWITSQIEQVVPELAASPIRYEELSGVHVDAPEVSLEREIIWLTEVLTFNAGRIKSFRAAANQVEQYVFSGELQRAISGLVSIEGFCGVTLWSVQLRLALEQASQGLEQQKRYSAEVRSVYKRGLLSFVTYHTSVRNEDKTTIEKFSEDVTQRIESHRHYDEAIKTYLRYRLISQWPGTLKGFADILRVEQSHSIFDIYETFIGVLQQIALIPELGLRQTIRHSLFRLEAIEDFRLAKLRFAISGELPQKVAYRRRDISDALFEGKVAVAAVRSHRHLRRRPEVDAWALLYGSMAFAHGTRPRSKSRYRPAQIAQLFGAALANLGTSGEGLAAAEKFALNLGTLPVSVALLDYISQIRRDRPDDPWRPWQIGLNSPTFGVEDRFPDIAADPEVGRDGTSKEVWSNFWDGAPAQTASDAIAAVCIRAAGYLRRKEFEQAALLLNGIDTETVGEPNRSMCRALLLHALYSIGDRPKVIELLAAEGARAGHGRCFLPILSSMQHYSWQDFKKAKPILAPIALHLLWRADARDVTASLLRFATSAFLKSSGAGLPSALFEFSSLYIRNQLVYFLREVCVPNIIDVSRVVRGSRAVLEERQAICAALRDLDPNNSALYATEVAELANQLALDEGKYIVGRTRIHVDTDAFGRWAARAVEEGFSRYRDLLDVQLAEGQNFDEVLRELWDAPDSLREAFKPETEADVLLVSLLRQMGEEFLANSTFGLDFYLSKRVRHQSFIGLIRSPLEISELITTRETEASPYNRNEKWIERLAGTNEEMSRELDAIFTEFSTKFDQALKRAKDEKFQLKSLDKPEGLLYLPLNSRLINLTRAIVREDYSIEDFVKSTVSVFWAALEYPLADARRYINDELKVLLAELMDGLRAQIRRAADSESTAFRQFDMEASTRAAEVQRALDDTVAWFTHSDLEAARRRFTLEQCVKIAVDSALKSQRAFDADIHKSLSHNYTLSAESLVFVHDVIFIALDNIHRHSELKKPRVDINVQVDETAGTLEIEVLSDTRTQQQRDTKERALAELRRIIDAKAVGIRTKREGRSGFLKIAASLGYSDKGKIEFGFLNRDKFRLAVTYSLVIYSSSAHD